MRPGLRAAALVAAGCLNACGGGGGGGGGTPPPTYTVGGNVTGLTGTVVIQLNGAGDLSFSANSPFTFAARLTAGSVFGVAVLSQPATQTCVVDNGSGLMPGANVTNVAVSCSALAGFSIGTASDPLAFQQWHLKNTGALGLQNAFSDTFGTVGVDINVDPVFGLGYTGAGVTVAVADSGLEIAHEDLAANVIPGGSWNFNNNTTDPTNTIDSDGDHGTSVSGLIAMAANNSKGGIGVAPRARLRGLNFLSMTPFPTEQAFLDSIGASNANPMSSDAFIFNQSFGVSPLAPTLVDPTEEAQYLAGVTSLRGGKGALYVKAAGNGFDTAGNTITCGNTGLSCENANFDPTNTLPFQIVVGAVNASGVKASYSTAGSAIWVSAPGGEFGLNAILQPGLPAKAYEPAMVTTDQSGCTKGFSRTTANTSGFNNGGVGVLLNPVCNYTNGMNGTSSATPVTVGVIALILEANPALTWRDVKHILASTANQIDAARAAVNILLTGGNYVAEPAWTTNGAGFKFHNWYGFGMVDASAAVTMAQTYTLGQLGTPKNTGFVASPALNVAIPDASVTGASSTVTVPAGTVSVIEAVQIRVSATHTFDSDLGIELLSPSGTRSVLKNIADGYDGVNLTNQVFLSNAFYGENPAGPWTIKVVDGVALDIGSLKGWAIRVYGH
ncbi:MAG TPA: S8 family peptidase [Burkholderiales bacterium]|nr:S8 family peptidase [Burkholderiales bacterium]